MDVSVFQQSSLPHTRILMHQPSAGLRGPESDTSIQAEVFRQSKRLMARLTAEQTGQTVERITGVPVTVAN